MNEPIFDTELKELKDYFLSRDFKYRYVSDSDYSSVVYSIIMNNCFTNKELKLLNKIETKNTGTLYISKVDNKIRFFKDRDLLDSYLTLLIPAFCGERTILIDRLNRFVDEHQDDDRIKILEENVNFKYKVDNLINELSGIKRYRDFSDDFMKYGDLYLQEIIYKRNTTFYKKLNSFIPGRLNFKSVSLTDRTKKVLIEEVKRFIFREIKKRNVSESNEIKKREVSESDVINWIEETSKGVFSDDEKKILIDGKLGNLMKKDIFLYRVESLPVKFTGLENKNKITVEIFDVKTEDGIVSKYVIDYLNNKIESGEDIVERYFDSELDCEGENIEKYFNERYNEEIDYFEKYIHILDGLETTDDINIILNSLLAHIYYNDVETSYNYKNVIKELL